MTARHFIGIGPGPTPGLVHLFPHGPHLDVDGVQSSALVADAVLWALLDQNRSNLGAAPTHVQIEP